MIYKFSILLLFVSFSCNFTQYSNKKKITTNKVDSLKNDFLSSYKPIQYLKNIRTNKVEKFKISINLDSVKKWDGKFFYKITLTGYTDSLYIGFDKNIVYSYDESRYYADKSFILEANNSSYYSFFCGYDYRVDKTESEFDFIEKDTVYKFYMTKLTDNKGSDYIYYAGEYPDKVFKEVYFSKKRGIIKIIFSDKNTNDLYITN